MPAEFAGKIERIPVSHPERDLLHRQLGDFEKLGRHFHPPPDQKIDHRSPEMLLEEPEHAGRTQIEPAAEVADGDGLLKVPVEIIDDAVQLFREIRPLIFEGKFDQNLIGENRAAPDKFRRPFPEEPGGMFKIIDECFRIPQRNQRDSDQSRRVQHRRQQGPGNTHRHLAGIVDGIAAHFGTRAELDDEKISRARLKRHAVLNEIEDTVRHQFESERIGILPVAIAPLHPIVGSRKTKLQRRIARRVRPEKVVELMKRITPDIDPSAQGRAVERDETRLSAAVGVKHVVFLICLE